LKGKKQANLNFNFKLIPGEKRYADKDTPKSYLDTANLKIPFHRRRYQSTEVIRGHCTIKFVAVIIRLATTFIFNRDKRLKNLPICVIDLAMSAYYLYINTALETPGLGVSAFNADDVAIRVLTDLRTQNIDVADRMEQLIDVMEDDEVAAVYRLADEMDIPTRPANPVNLPEEEAIVDDELPNHIVAPIVEIIDLTEDDDTPTEVIDLTNDEVPEAPVEDFDVLPHYWIDPANLSDIELGLGKQRKRCIQWISSHQPKPFVCVQDEDYEDPEFDLPPVKRQSSK